MKVTIRQRLRHFFLMEHVWSKSVIYEGPRSFAAYRTCEICGEVDEYFHRAADNPTSGNTATMQRAFDDCEDDNGIMWAEFEKMLTRLSASPPDSGWVDVRDLLPEGYGLYNVAWFNNVDFNTCSAIFDGGEWYSDEEILFPHTVVAWMEIPPFK